MRESAVTHHAVGERQRHVASVDGGTLRYRLMGPDTAPTLVLLHSLGTDGRTWDGCIPDLVADYRLIVPDTRGHGASSPAHAQSAHLWADDIDRIVRDVGASVVSLAGVSMGGIQAVAFAAEHPDLVGALIVADSFLVLPEQVRAAKVAALSGDIDTAPMSRIAAEYLAATFIEPYPAGAKQVAAAITAIDPDSYLAATSACFGVDLVDEAARIEAPTLVLWGDRDDKTPRDLSERIAATIPGAMFDVVPGAGHLSNVDNPAGFSRAVRSFLIDR